MGDFFTSSKNRVFSALSAGIALTTLFFIAAQVKILTLIDLGLQNDVFYLLFPILGILALGAVAYFAGSFDWKRELTALLLIFLPGALILAYGLNASKNFHYIFMLALGGYIILSGIVIAARFIAQERLRGEKDSAALTTREWFRAQGLPALLLVLFSTTLFFFFAFHRITEYAAVDEPLWFDGRINKYWKNIGERDWRGTNISDKPGITLAIASGPGLWFKSTKDYKTIHKEGEVISLKNDVESFYLAYRLPLLIVITLILPLFYFFLERLLGRRDALMSYVLIATSPILIGMSKIINPDSLLWLLAPLSLLSYLVFLKRRSFRYLIFSGIFLGLTLLTKYVGNILFVFFLGLIFLEYLYQPKNAVIAFADYLKRSLKHLALLSFAALTTFYLLFPAVWVKPYKILTGTVFSQAFEKVAPLFLVLIGLILMDQWLNRSRFTTTFLGFLHERTRQGIALIIGGGFFLALALTVFNTWSGMSLYQFTELLASPKTIAGKSDLLGAFLTNFYPFIFGVTPLIFASLFLTPFFFLKRRFVESTALRTSLYLIIFILLYYIGTTVNNVAAIVRYQIMLFPLAAIIAGITLGQVMRFLRAKYQLHIPSPVLAASIAMFLGTLTLISTPFPLSYASSFLPALYHTDVKDMGAGSYEAAQYLNSLPDAKNMMIWTDKDGVCKFFVGNCSRGRNYSMLRERGLDYIVVSAGRESRTTKMMGGDISNQKPGIIRFDQYYQKSNPAYEIHINERPTHFVKIFKFSE